MADDIATFEAMGEKRAERIASGKAKVLAQVAVKKPPNVLTVRVPVNPKLATGIPKAKPGEADFKFFWLVAEACVIISSFQI